MVFLQKKTFLVLVSPFQLHSWNLLWFSVSFPGHLFFGSSNIMSIM